MPDAPILTEMGFSGPLVGRGNPGQFSVDCIVIQGGPQFVARRLSGAASVGQKYAVLSQ